MPDLTTAELMEKSVTAGDVATVKNGVISLIVPMMWGHEGNYTLPPAPPEYWSPVRDDILRATVYQEAFWAGAVGIAITRMAAKGWEVKSDVPLRARRFRELFLYADGRNTGWVQFLSKHLRDFLCTDNGAFVEIVRQNSGIASPIVGLRHLDSRRCRRTGDPETPVLFTDRMGKIHEIKAHQVMCFSDMPDPGETFFGVGLCAASRAYKTIYKLGSIEWYLSEKVSGQRPLAIYIVNGMMQAQIEGSVAAAKEQAVGKGLAAYMGAVIVGVPQDKAPEVATIPLAELPDRFNRKEEFDISVLTYANALGLDVQDLQPLTGQALGTGAQSQVLDDKASGKGLVSWAQQWTHQNNEFVLPDLTSFMFVEKDYRDKERQAAVAKAFAEVSKIRTEAGVTTPAQELQVQVDLDLLPKEFLPADQTPGDALSDDEKPVETPEAKPEAAQPPEQPTDKPAEPERTKALSLTALVERERTLAAQLFEEVTEGE